MICYPWFQEKDLTAVHTIPEQLPVEVLDAENDEGDVDFLHDTDSEVEDYDEQVEEIDSLNVVSKAVNTPISSTTPQSTSKLANIVDAISEEQARLTPQWRRMQDRIESMSGDALDNLLRDIQIEKNLRQRERFLRRDIYFEGTRPSWAIPGKESVLG